MKRKLQVLALVIIGALSMIPGMTVEGQKPRRNVRDSSKKFEDFVRDNDITEDEYWKISYMTEKTLAKVPGAGTYIVDLTRAGAIYEFDPSAGPIDFKRVAIRTARGEEMLATRLEKALSKQELPRWYSQGFRMANAADFRSDEGGQPPARSPSVEMGFTCNGNYCDCSGVQDCMDMIYTNVCGGDFVACTRRGGGPVRCICGRR